MSVAFRRLRSGLRCACVCQGYEYTDKKENKIFLKYKEIQSGAVAKSYMRKGFLIYEVNGQDGRLDSESTYSWDSRFVFWQSVKRYSTLMTSFQIKY